VTPEGLIKDKIKIILRKYNVYYFMPVQTGLGAAGLDFHCVVRWHDVPVAFFVEAKRPDGKLTLRQSDFIKARSKLQNATTFVISGDVGLERLERWLRALQDPESLLYPHQFSVTTVSP
jgi:hypothetical protein